MQIGIKNAVNWIIIRANPSIPNVKLILIDWNHSILCKNWNWTEVGSKQSNKAQLKFKIIKDQKREKLQINELFVLLQKDKTRQPNKGKQISVNNIKKKHA